MNVTINHRGRIAVVAYEGSLTIGFTADLLEEGTGKALRSDAKGLVLDLRKMSHLDSAGIGVIVGCAKKAGELGKVVKIVLDRATVASRIFKVTQLERAFEIFDDLDEAVASFA
ncbi:MAG TPA: STAS domain-containing protein [Candidatus Polarisedimenticolaceae bacterium]|nr:STAS domain-containing protein [Candidatus Polarisedimenticolaceae bacterium]